MSKNAPGAIALPSEALPKPLHSKPIMPKRPLSLRKKWDDLLKISELEYFARIAEKNPALISAPEIREMKRLISAIASPGGCGEEKKAEAMGLAFRALSRIILFTRDEESRRAAVEARKPLMRLSFCKSLVLEAELLALGSARSFTARGIKDLAYIARIVLNDPVCNKEENEAWRERLFYIFSSIGTFAHDEEARAAAMKPLLSKEILYPFGPKYGQVRKRDI